MRATLTLLALAAALAGCSHASISSIPMQIEGVGTVYRYQGRANFAHQMALADQMIADDCKARNGGKPVIVDLQKVDLGTINMGSAQSTTRLNGTATGNRFNGTAATSTFGGGSAMRNSNQEVLYKCVKE